MALSSQSTNPENRRPDALQVLISIKLNNYHLQANRQIKQIVSRRHQNNQSKKQIKKIH